MVQLVNGFSCSNSADVALARRGINPAGPKQALVPTAAAQAVTVQAQAQATPPAAEPERTGRGRIVNLIA
jgi:hypothetical protein